MRVIILTLIFMGTLAVAGSARGAILAALAEGSDSTARNGWQIVIVDLGAAAGEEQTVGIRDVRGGMEATRTVLAGRQKIWLALPLVGRLPW